MKEIILKIEGMHCTGCSNRLEKVLNNSEGIENAKVIFDKAEAIISYNDEKISVEGIKDVIKDAGFEGEEI